MVKVSEQSYLSCWQWSGCKWRWEIWMLWSVGKERQYVSRRRPSRRFRYAVHYPLRHEIYPSEYWNSKKGTLNNIILRSPRKSRQRRKSWQRRNLGWTSPSNITYQSINPLSLFCRFFCSLFVALWNLFVNNNLTLCCIDIQYYSKRILVLTTRLTRPMPMASKRPSELSMSLHEEWTPSFWETRNMPRNTMDPSVSTMINHSRYNLILK